MKLYIRSPRILRTHKRGTILYLALLFIAVINMLALAYVKVIPVESNSFLRSQRAVVAHYVCEAGIFDTMAWITHELKHGREPSPSNNTVLRTGNHDGWTWEVSLRPDSQSPPGGAASLRFYEVTSRAYAPNSTSAARTIRATFGEETFARYTNYVDNFPSSIYYNLISGKPFIEGHVHTNTYFRMLPSDERYASNSPPSFMGYVTSAGVAPGQWEYDGVNYMQMSQAPFDAAENPIPERYERLYLGGQAGLNTGVNRIEMPQTAASLAVRAWGEDTARPDTDGVHLNTTGDFKGGVYVVGEVESIELEAIGDGASKITITQGGQETVIVEAYDNSVPYGGLTVGAGQTGYFPPTATATVLNGHTNGVIHATGSIDSLSGTNRGPRLISADLETNKEIKITGSVLRRDTPQGSRPPGPRDALGLVCYKLKISKDIPRDTSNPLYLYFSYLAGKEEAYPQGGLVVEDYLDADKPRGAFYQYGAAGSGRTYATGSGSTTGYGYRHYFDEHLLENPPPFYPTTGKLPIRSWREEDGTL